MALQSGDRLGPYEVRRPGSWVPLFLAVAAGLFLLLPRMGIEVGVAKQVMESTAQAAVLVWIVLVASTGFSGFAGWALQSRAAVAIGKISYGIVACGRRAWRQPRGTHTR